MARRRGDSSANSITLSVDVGSTHTKATLLDSAGHLLPEVKVDTPRRLTRTRLVALLLDIASSLPNADRVSVGLPGIVHRGTVYSLPVLGSRDVKGLDLVRTLERRLHAPVRVVNDAEMHGLGVIRGRGVELVLTLGTGLGTALFLNGSAGPRFQFVPAPRRPEPEGGAYGDAARERLGNRAWSGRVRDLITTLDRLTNFDRCYVGGGNAEKLRIHFGSSIIRVESSAAFMGAVRLWERHVET